MTIPAWVGVLFIVLFLALIIVAGYLALALSECRKDLFDAKVNAIDATGRAQRYAEMMGRPAPALDDQGKDYRA